MSDCAAQYETSGYFVEAWQRVSSTSLRKKIVHRWDRVYVGIPGEAAAKELLEAEMLTYSNVNEGTINLVNGGMWECRISFKTSDWVEPPVYKNG